MVILYILGLMGLIGVICVVISICTFDYTLDEKGKEEKDKIDDWVQI
ncbi:unnamed protein product [marine sediment metagenome]|jgi:hypothetical protein|uniref:Uncharacterized protein n=1 Tax=marine sediment metagenome TaxID=412755 RepID=X1QM59_9ZZZZ